MRYNLRYKKAAEEDVTEIFRYIKDTYKSPLTANRFVDELEMCIENIALHPETHSPCRSLQLKQYGSANLKQTLFRKKWFILFEVVGQFIVIQRIIHGSLVKE